MRRPTHGSTRIGLIPSERAFQTMDESHIAWSLLWLVAFAIIPSGGLPEVSAYVTSVPHMLFDSLVAWLVTYWAPDARIIAQTITQLIACVYSFSWILHALRRHVTLAFWQIACIILIPFTFVYVPFFCLVLLVLPR